ncbi:receptor-type tyrosine-protein phosphatase epsilon-like [Dermatophagoides pteronyssinus]|uniref:receptor-type tyrosine-protein phosphatase epsilon-like n=1 Tax=Dermatophagoides pteronyssinus TaxID=6956 RepID=UPI003F6669F6
MFSKSFLEYHCTMSLLMIIVYGLIIAVVIDGQPPPPLSSSSGEIDDVSTAIQQCYDSPADLFQVFPQLNNTFKIKIKNKCLQLPELEIYLYIFDLSIVDQIFAKEIDQLDSTKVNSIKINRPTMIFGRQELTNFQQPLARFKFGIVFFDHTGVVHKALHPKVFYFHTNQSSSSTIEILLIIILGILLLITCILLAMLIYINYCGNRRQKANGIFFWRKLPNRTTMKAHLLNNNNNDQENPSEAIIFEPKSNIIYVDKIINQIPELLNEERIRQEYDSVPKSKMNSWNDGRLPQHKSKNRYGNLLPYDHTRVILKEDSPEDTSYINANFIDGYRRPRRYIASQGPIDTTIEDFWRCIWQYKCQQLVMLTNLEESGRMKCEKYWPDSSRFYGRIKVTLQTTELFADYVIRTFLLEKFTNNNNGDSQSMIVNQYHFISWPDHNVPLYVCTLISFMNRIRSDLFYKQAPHIIVHCSAGIGRTGAFILIDSMLEMALKEKKIDILGHFCRMRMQRINMVEKFSQYLFVYHILIEALSHESSDICCQDFQNYFESMTKGNHNQNNHRSHRESKCRLRKQFEILNIMSNRKSNQSTTGNQSSSSKFGLMNSKLNRRDDVIPPDNARVILPNHEDYINAVYINGYRKKDAYIVTQIPFENNRQQFWNMIEYLKCTTIVLLGNVFQDEQIYWPTILNKKFDFNNNELSVTLIQEEILSNNTSSTTMIIMRTFQIHPNDLIVRQFHLKNFNVVDDGTTSGSSTTKILSTKTSSTSTIRSCYELIELREKLDQYSSITSTSSSATSSHPLVVQCIDGVQFSGLFCAADFIFERIKEEQQIDVFLAVQKIRANRPQFIINYEQYLYLHQVALAYLQSFEQYANFK